MSMSDEMSPVFQPIVGDVVRLEIPLQSVINLRRVAEELRGLAAHFDRIGRFHEGKALGAMLEVRELVRSSNRKLGKIRGRGRPSRKRKPY